MVGFFGRKLAPPTKDFFYTNDCTDESEGIRISSVWHFSREKGVYPAQRARAKFPLESSNKDHQRSAVKKICGTEILSCARLLRSCLSSALLRKCKLRDRCLFLRPFIIIIYSSCQKGPKVFSWKKKQKWQSKPKPQTLISIANWRARWWHFPLQQCSRRMARKAPKLSVWKSKRNSHTVEISHLWNLPGQFSGGAGKNLRQYVWVMMQSHLWKQCTLHILFVRTACASIGFKGVFQAFCCLSWLGKKQTYPRMIFSWRVLRHFQVSSGISSNCRRALLWEGFIPLGGFIGLISGPEGWFHCGSMSGGKRLEVSIFSMFDWFGKLAFRSDFQNRVADTPKQTPGLGSNNSFLNFCLCLINCFEAVAPKKWWSVVAPFCRGNLVPIFFSTVQWGESISLLPVFFLFCASFVPPLATVVCFRISQSRSDPHTSRPAQKTMWMCTTRLNILHVCCFWCKGCFVFFFPFDSAFFKNISAVILASLWRFFWNDFHKFQCVPLLKQVCWIIDAAPHLRLKQMKD